MKILFAVNDDSISEAIVRKYQKEYKEILSYKNVYYFNAILRELQRDKSYSRIVISEDLEPFANNNYNSIDKFLYDKYSNISEETKNINNENIDIILICADRRKKTDSILLKIYKKNIYNAIIGQDRSIDEVCRLINQPKGKETAKKYYGIQETELEDTESEESVSEAEVENIRAHYARLGKNEDKYVDSFNNIVAQYSDSQLKIIIKYLPMNVKAVLEEKSPKYQQLVTTSVVTGIDAKRKTASYKEKINNREHQDKKEDVVEQLIKPKSIKSVVVPTNLTTKNVQKVIIPEIEKPYVNEDIIINKGLTTEKKQTEEEKLEDEKEEFFEIKESEQLQDEEVSETKESEQLQDEEVSETKESEQLQDGDSQLTSKLQEPHEESNLLKKGRGRPRKKNAIDPKEQQPKRGRGRPKKQQEKNINNELNNSEEETIDLFEIEKPKTENTVEKLQEIDDKEELDLFDLEENTTDTDLFSIEEEKSEIADFEEPANVDLFSIEEEKSEIEDSEEPTNVDLFSIETEKSEYDATDAELFSNVQEVETSKTEQIQEIQRISEDIQKPDNLNIEPQDSDIIKTYNSNSNFTTLLTGDKKIVAFVGTTKNGTSFIVNNTAEMLASMGIKTAILDMTQTKNAYYIYTNNEESLRIVAKNCMENLENGIAEGIEVKKNLTVYTEMPGDEKGNYNIEAICETLLLNYSAILIDTDFNTDFNIFTKVQELYLVQTMDILTIQPLTAFLRNLKSKNILEPEKLKIVINKSERIRSLNIKILIGGMSCYNSPSMTYMTELFNKDNIRYCEIPFEVQNYVKYLDSLVNCSISLNGYTKQFMIALRELANMVYPLVNKQTSIKNNGKKEMRDPFSNKVNDTLNKMKNQY